jgi:hypothetical protein
MNYGRMLIEILPGGLKKNDCEITYNVACRLASHIEANRAYYSKCKLELVRIL